VFAGRYGLIPYMKHVTFRRLKVKLLAVHKGDLQWANHLLKQLYHMSAKKIHKLGMFEACGSSWLVHALE
jgi:hypothetical protein